MKVLMLNGSGNADGSTRAGLDIMAEVFAANGMETEIVTVGAKPVRDCLGCNKCAEKGKCIFDDDAVNGFVERRMLRTVLCSVRPSTMPIRRDAS